MLVYSFSPLSFLMTFFSYVRVMEMDVDVPGFDSYIQRSAQGGLAPVSTGPGLCTPQVYVDLGSKAFVTVMSVQ